MPKNLRSKVQPKKNLLAILTALTAIGLVIVYYQTRPQPAIPTTIQKKAGFRIVVPGGNNMIDKKSVKFDSKQGVLSFKSNSVSSSDCNFSEQPTPDAFIDSNQIYPALLQKMREYSEIQTARGNVALTHPVELKGSQAAVINNSELLMFINCASDKTDAQWLQYVNNLENL